jgi:hypothetical protein
MSSSSPHTESSTLPKHIEHQCDAILTQCATMCAPHAPVGESAIVAVLDVFFGFLERRTDFFVDPKRAGEAVRAALRKRTGGDLAAKVAAKQMNDSKSSTDASAAIERRKAEEETRRRIKAERDADEERARVERLRSKTLEMEMAKSKRG